MIIVKTKNGDVFINDKASQVVQHLRDKKMVVIRSERDAVNANINDVEGVIYTNEAQPTHWVDEGSEIQRIKKQLEEHTEWSNKLRDDHLKLMTERDGLKARVAELEARLVELEPKEDPDRWWTNNVDSAPINVFIGHIRKHDYCGYGVRLSKLFDKYDIKTVGDLLRISRRDFKKYQGVGGGCLSRIDDALNELYDIKGW